MNLKHLCNFRVYKMRIETPAGVEGQSWILRAPGTGIKIIEF